MAAPDAIVEAVESKAPEKFAQVDEASPALVAEAVEIMDVQAEAAVQEVAPTDESTLSDTDAIPEAASASEAVEIKTVNPIESGTCVEEAAKLCGESKEVVEELKTDEESSTAE